MDKDELDTIKWKAKQFDEIERRLKPYRKDREKIIRTIERLIDGKVRYI